MTSAVQQQQLATARLECGRADEQRDLEAHQPQRATQQPHHCWRDQPDDVLQSVVDRLGQRDIRSLALVCKEWAIQVDRVLPSLRTTSPNLPRTLDRFQSLQAVEVAFQSTAPTPAQLQALAGARSLTKVRLHNRCPVSSRPALQGLGVLAQGAVRLRTLELCCYRLRPDCGLAEMGAARPLARLGLSGCELTDDRFLHAAVGPHAPALLELDAEGLVVQTAAAYVGLAKLAGLRSLVLRHASKLGGGVCGHVAGLTSLTRLDLSRSGLDAYSSGAEVAELAGAAAGTASGTRGGQEGEQSMGAAQEGSTTGDAAAAESGVVTDASLRALRGLVQLRVLSLAGHRAITEEGVALLGSLPALESLDVRQPLQLLPPPAPVLLEAAAEAGAATDASLHAGTLTASAGPYGMARSASVASLLAAAPKAVDLSVSRASVCADSFSAMARLTSLTRLAMSDCDSLRDADLYTLAPLSKLAAISLEGCGQGLSDIGVVRVVRSFPRLRQLTLTYASARVSRFGLSSLGQLKGLEDLDLSGCEGVDDALLQEMLPCLPGLTRLRLANCSRLTDVACMAIAANLPGLQFLSLEHCRLLTDRGLKHLEKLRQLQLLNVHGSRASTRVREWPGFKLVNIVVDRPFWWMA